MSAATKLILLGCLGLALCNRDFRLWFERLLAWIVAPRPVWFGALSAMVLVVLFRYSHTDHERAFQYAGLALQLLGIGAVARGISQKLSLFGQTGLREWLAKWARQFRAIFSRGTSGSVGAALGGVTMTGHAGMITQTRTKPSTLDQRLDQIEEDIVRLQSAATTLKAELTTERDERIAADERERQARAAEIATVRAVTETAMVGSFRDEIVGLIWLASGTVFATIPAVIAGWW